MTIPVNYYSQLARVESGNNPFAKASTSSASGLYQFTRSTWEGMGLNWSDRFNEQLQHTAIEKLTNQNANSLIRNGVTPDAGSLYGAHFLGAGTASKVYNADNGDDLASIVGSSVMKANSFLKGMSVGDFKDWAAGKMTGVGLSAVKSAVGSVSKEAEKIVSSISTHDVKNGAKAAAQFASGDVIGAALTVAGVGGEDNPVSKLLKWLKDLFSANTAARFAAVLIGMVLIGIAIFYLLDGDKYIKEVAATAAKAAIVA